MVIGKWHPFIEDTSSFSQIPITLFFVARWIVSNFFFFHMTFR